MNKITIGCKKFGTRIFGTYRRSTNNIVHHDSPKWLRLKPNVSRNLFILLAGAKCLTPSTILEEGFIHKLFPSFRAHLVARMKIRR